MGVVLFLEEEEEEERARENWDTCSIVDERGWDVV